MVRSRRGYRPKKIARKGKRWAFNASANLGPFGKYAVGFKRGVSNVIHGLEVPQHSVIADGTNLISNVTQTTVYTFPLTFNIPQGTSNSQRMGDEIHLESLKVNHSFQTATTTPTDNETHCRLMLVKHTKQVSGTIWNSSGLALTDLFFAPGGSTVTTDAIVDPKRATVLFDTTCKLTPRIAGQKCLSQCKFTIPIKQKFVYQSGTAFGKDLNLYLIAIAFQPNGTPGTTNVASMYTNTDLIFKNIR